MYIKYYGIILFYIYRINVRTIFLHLNDEWSIPNSIKIIINLFIIQEVIIKI